jgi:hypothetical protein
MLAKDLKKFGFLISSGLTVFFGALINLLSSQSLREVLNALAVVFSVGIATLIIHLTKVYSNTLLIKYNNERIVELEKVMLTYEQVDKLKEENHRLKKDMAKIDFIV